MPVRAWRVRVALPQLQGPGGALVHGGAGAQGVHH